MIRLLSLQKLSSVLEVVDGAVHTHHSTNAARVRLYSVCGSVRVEVLGLEIGQRRKHRNFNFILGKTTVSEWQNNITRSSAGLPIVQSEQHNILQE